MVKNDDNVVKIHVPNTKFWVWGERITRNTWNMFLINPQSNYKELVKGNRSTKTFVIFSNVILKTPFPYSG